MSVTSYKLGRDAVADLPGVENEDIVDVTINVSANQLDVTTFKTIPLTKYEYMAGLADITIDVMCRKHTAEVTDSGPQDVAGLPDDLEAEVLEIKESVTPKGLVEFTISYGLREPDSAGGS